MSYSRHRVGTVAYRGSIFACDGGCGETIVNPAAAHAESPDVWRLFPEVKPESPALFGRFSRPCASRGLSRTCCKATLPPSPVDTRRSGVDQVQRVADYHVTDAPGLTAEPVASSPRPLFSGPAYDRLSKVFNPCSTSVPLVHLFLRIKAGLSWHKTYAALMLRDSSGVLPAPCHPKASFVVLLGFSWLIFAGF
jgi:hypothetical protein